jgi:hypothetical protein
MESLLSPAIGLFSGIIITLVGALWARRLGRAKPRILVDQLDINNHEGSTGNVTPNTRLISEIETEPLIRARITRAAKVSEKQYVGELQNALKEVGDLTDYLLPSVKKAGDEMRLYLSSNDYDSLRQTWLENQRGIWQLLADSDFSYNSKDGQKTWNLQAKRQNWLPTRTK